MATKNNKVSVKLFKPYPKQREWLDTILHGEEKYITLTCGRQVGKSLIGINLASYWALQKKCTTMLVSPVYSQVTKLFKAIEDAFADTNLIKRSNKSEYIIEFTNGSTIIARSADNPDSLRGYTVDYLIVDEAAFIKAEVWDKVLRATTMVKGKKVLFLTTPNGKNYIYDLFQRGLSQEYPNYVSLTGNAFDNPYVDAQELIDLQKTLPEHIYKQEILGEFVDNTAGVFPDPQRYCVMNEYPKPNGRTYAGLDLGRQEDYTVLTIFDEQGRLIDFYRDRQKSWDIIISEVIKRLKKYNPILQVEVNNIGDVLYEQIKKKYPKTYPFQTTSSTKVNVIEDLIMALNQDKLMLPSKQLQPELIAEFETFTYTYNPKTRNIKYEAKQGFHDDIIMALAVGYNTLKEKKNTGNYLFR